MNLVVATADAAEAAWLGRGLGEALTVVVAPTLTELGAHAPAAAVVVLGRGLGEREVARALDELTAAGATAPVVRIGDPARIAADARVAFVAARGLAPGAVAALLISLAWRRPAAASTAPRPLDAAEARRRDRAFAASRGLATVDSAAAAEASLADAACVLVDADRAACLLVDAGSGELWSPARLADAGDDRRADRGLAGWAARTGGVARAERARDDARWCAEVDDPGGAGDERALVVPVLGSGREVHAVLVAIRRGDRPAFTDDDAASLQALAAHAGPLLEQLSRHAEARAVLASADAPALFRHDAVAAQRQARWGALVQVTPRWMRWTWWGLLACLMGFAGFVTVGRSHTYARGPAIVRMASRTELATRAGGNVAVVAVGAGTPVRAGDVLVRLDDGDQAAEVARLERAFADRLRERLLAPADPALAAAVAAQRLELERARAELDRRAVRAPRDGTIGDVRVRTGQWLEAGDVVASLVDPRAGAELVALVPAGERPRLARGQRVRLELAGYQHAYVELAVDAVTGEAMGPAEARRYLGRVADDVAVPGPVVLVHVRLPASFVADGQTYHYVDGMSGRVDIEIGAERIIHALLPGLKRL